MLATLTIIQDCMAVYGMYMAVYGCVWAVYGMKCCNVKWSHMLWSHSHIHLKDCCWYWNTSTWYSSWSKNCTQLYVRQKINSATVIQSWAYVLSFSTDYIVSLPERSYSMWWEPKSPQNVLWNIIPLLLLKWHYWAQHPLLSMGLDHRMLAADVENNTRRALPLQARGGTKLLIGSP